MGEAILWVLNGILKLAGLRMEKINTPQMTTAREIQDDQKKIEAFRKAEAERNLDIVQRGLADRQP